MSIDGYVRVIFRGTTVEITMLQSHIGANMPFVKTRTWVDCVDALNNPVYALAATLEVGQYESVKLAFKIP